MGIGTYILWLAQSPRVAVCCLAMVSFSCYNVFECVESSCSLPVQVPVVRLQSSPDMGIKGMVAQGTYQTKRIVDKRAAEKRTGRHLQ